MKKKLKNSKTIKSFRKNHAKLVKNKDIVKEKKKNVFLKYLVITSISIYAVITVFFSFYHIYYANKIIGNVYIEDILVGGDNVDVALEKVKLGLKPKEKIDIEIDGVHKFTLYLADIDFTYAYEDTVSDAFNVGRDAKILSFVNKIKSFSNRYYITPKFYVDDKKLNVYLDKVLSDVTLDTIEPAFVLKDGIITVSESRDGKVLDKKYVKEEMLKAINDREYNSLSFETRTVQPSLSLNDLDLIKNDVMEIAGISYKIEFEEKSWSIEKEEILSLVAPVKEGDEVKIKMDRFKLRELVEKISSEINRSPRAQILEIEENKAIEFVSSLDGIEVDIENSIKQIGESILSKNEKLELTANITKAPETENEYKIEEQVSVGSSRFKGSIASRIHNIGLAASRIDKTLIAPGEVFSFVKTVGRIDSTTGYKTAYVISGGRTVLGDGGGVCQVSTTLFRAALNAGLPIVSRTAHAYRVGYYEQDAGPGLDATIFSPSVDLKFKNDTDTYLLITSQFDPKEMTLSFKLYGKKDGRIVEISKPESLSRTAPPATIYEEDPSMPKGKKIQLEHAVWGGSVVFNRIVKKGDEEIKDTFKSNYRAWPAVFRVGAG